MGFSRQEYWSGLPRPPPGDLLDPGIESKSHVSCTGSWVFYHQRHLGSTILKQSNVYTRTWTQTDTFILTRNTCFISRQSLSLHRTESQDFSLYNHRISEYGERLRCDEMLTSWLPLGTVICEGVLFNFYGTISKEQNWEPYLTKSCLTVCDLTDFVP